MRPFAITRASRASSGLRLTRQTLVRLAGAMHGSDGFLRVDYGRLGTRLMTFDEWQRRSLAAVTTPAQ